MTDRDYIDRTIATVRNHRDADNCWPQWANIFADEIEAKRAECERLRADLRTAVKAARDIERIASEDESIAPEAYEAITDHTRLIAALGGAVDE